MTAAALPVRTGPRGGSPVVLLHPVGLDLTYWGAQIEAPGADHDVIALDLPGHGRSPGTPADWTFERAAAAVAQVIRAAGDQPAHVFGLSVGSMIAQALALAEPALVRSLTLIGTAATFSDDVRAGMRGRAETVREKGMAAVLEPTIQRWFRPETVARRPDLVDRVTRTLLADDPAVHAAMWDMIAGFDTVADLDRISCPTLIPVGEDDPSTPPAAAEVVRDRSSVLDNPSGYRCPNCHRRPNCGPPWASGKVQPVQIRATRARTPRAARCPHPLTCRRGRRAARPPAP